MGERKIVVDDSKIEYQGLFNSKELYRVIENWIKDHGYDKREASNTEYTKHEGKFIELKLAPWRTITDYAKIIMKVKIVMNDLKDVEVKSDGHRLRMNQGKLVISFQGIVETDWEGRWISKPTLFFLRTLYDKYIYRMYSSRYDGEISCDVNELASEIKRYLNMNKKY